MSATVDDPWVVAALAGLTGMGPRRLDAVLSQWSPADAWRAIAAHRLQLEGEALAPFGRRLGSLLDAWAAEAAQRSPDRLSARCRALGIEVVTKASPAYPRRLRADIEPPQVLFAWGGLAGIGEPDETPCVAVVGTRRATAYGLGVARELGHDLSAEQVSVVSGLAIGIDAAAHRGALEVEGAPPVGVVGSGLDVVYPRRNGGLWRDVARRGLLLSEAPPGTPPEPWRFPARNRIIAALADVLVVVESPEAGGSMITVDEATRRQRTVMAVPGSVYSPASAGPNGLLFDGCSPVRNADDVLSHLGFGMAAPTRSARRGKATPLPFPRARAAGEASPAGAPPRARPPAGRGLPDPAAARPDLRAVLDALGWEPALLDEIVVRSGLSLPTAIRAVDDLVHHGVLVRDSGFLRRVAPSDPAPAPALASDHDGTPVGEAPLERTDAPLGRQCLPKTT
jgi:DNA processing protein